MAITFHFETPVPLKARRRLKNFILEMVQAEGKIPGDFSFVFCSDEYLLEMNNRFLTHDFYTDIITFDMAPPGSGVIEGEIFISIDRVKDNAQQFKNPWQSELYRVIFHGILHLCGYNDKTAIQQKLMRSKEDHYLHRYQLSH
jgi:rRNA maturation RNase YbeY